MKIKFLSIMLLAMTVMAVIVAQPYKLFTSDNELPGSLATYIYQDRYGFIWIATENGLVKYDGARFITFSHNPSDPHSLAHDFVTSITEDNRGHLFLSTYSGVQVYDYFTNSFSENVTWEDGTTFGENSNFICRSKKGEIYSAGYSLCKLRFDGKRLTARKLADSKTYKNYSKILEDSEGTLWASSNGQNKIVRLRNERIVEQHTFSGRNSAINDFTITQDGSIFATVYGEGLKEYQRQTKRFVTIDASLDDSRISSIFPQGDRIYMSGEQIPILVYDTRRKKTSEYKREAINFNLKDCNIAPFMIDREGNSWMGVQQKGVMMIPVGNSPFSYIGSHNPDVDLISKSPTSAIFRASDGTMWIGTSGEGIFCMKETNKACIRHFAKPANVTGFLEDPNGKIWISASNAGVYCFNPQTGQMRDDALSKEVAIPTAHDIEVDKQNRLWIATMGYGLFCHDIRTNRTISINKINPLIHKWITKSYLSGDGHLWIGTYDGIECIDINKDNFATKRFLKRTIVYDILQDKKQNLWLATSVGLFNISTKGDTIRHYTTKDGFPSHSFASIQIDNEGKLWVSSNQGLSKLNPTTDKVINFYSGDGLQGNEFCKNSSFKDANGQLWFGGNNGVTYFSPNNVRPDNNPLKVRIVAVTHGDEEISTATLSGGKKIINAPVFETESMTLAHSDNSFSIFFATEELTNNNKVQFEYTINGKPWQRLPVGVHSVSFSNLATGNYQFSVRAVNNLRGSKARTLRITIRPLWYETWWATCLFVSFITAFIALIILALRAHYHEKNERIISEKQKAMHEAQTRFFIDISHEIRTPLTLILGPIRKLIANDCDETRKGSYSTIQRNANRILRLMDQMIDIRKADKHMLTLHFAERNVTEVVNNIYNDFREQARMKNIEFTFIFDETEDFRAWIDPNYFDKIVINLVSNALKYTQAGGCVTVSLKTEEDKRFLVSVADNGPGIAECDKERVFERFYRGQKVEGSTILGAGIGLALTRTLVEMHHGTIGIESSTAIPSGTTFTVTLPLGRAHLDDSELIVETEPEQTERQATIITENNTQETEKHTVYSKTKYRILLVDDETEILNYLTHELAPDFHVTACCNGKEALQMVQQREYDLIVSDLMMPVMDGEELCQKIRRNINLNDIPFIMLTANAEESTMIEELNNGVDDYIVKPISTTLLRSRIYNLLHSRERLYNNYSGNQIDDSKLEKIEVKTPDDILMERIMKVVNANLSNPELTVEMLADTIGISRVHLNRKLKELTNQTARDYIRNVRLRQAATLLQQGNHAVYQVAFLVGFNNPSNFATAFKAMYGVAPKDYK